MRFESSTWDAATSALTYLRVAHPDAKTRTRGRTRTSERGMGLGPVRISPPAARARARGCRCTLHGWRARRGECGSDRATPVHRTPDDLLEDVPGISNREYTAGLP